MKNILVVPLLLLFLTSCSGVKKTQEEINLGNYGTAIDNALKNIAENKSKKSNQHYIRLLEEAYKKNTDRELQHILFLKKDNGPANLESIFNGYSQLKSIQERIKPLLPLRLVEENRDASFVFKDYDDHIIKSKKQFSDYLYTNATNLLKTGSQKQDFRKSYDSFVYLKRLSPDYKDFKQEMDMAYDKGLDYVKVIMINDSEQIIPSRLEEELLNFNTYGLNEPWTVYHTNTLRNKAYDYEMQLAFVNIDISPEQIREKQIVREKQVKDGYKYAVDRNGSALKDSLGNKIKVDKFKTVKCNFYQFTQFKRVQVTGNIVFFDLHTQQQMNSYPLASEFIFDYQYAKYDGDIRALEDDMLILTKRSSVPFPSNEQMVYDAGEDIKNKLKSILNRHRFQ
jgi:hypothetical protein